MSNKGGSGFFGVPDKRRPKEIGILRWDDNVHDMRRTYRYRPDMPPEDYRYAMVGTESRKDFLSVNRRQPLAGSSTLWIPPSTYVHHVARWMPLSGGYAEYPADPNGAVDTWKTGPDFTQAKTLEVGTPALMGGGIGFTRARDSNMENRAITECLLKLKDQKASMGENLATAVQTVDLFGSLAKDLFSAYRAARNLSFGRFPGILNHSYQSLLRRGSKRIAQDYLKYIYGLRPLYQDIYGMYELMQEQLKPALLVTAERTITDNPVFDHTARDTTYRLRYVYKYTYKRACRISLTGRISDEYARQVARAGITNPLSIAWEVVPWSFLLDWSLPIGNVIAALDATYGLTFVGGHLTTRINGTTIISLSENENIGGRVVKTSPRGVRFESGHERVKLTNWPKPFPYVKSPFSSSHGLTALALLRGNFKKLFS